MHFPQVPARDDEIHPIFFFQRPHFFFRSERSFEVLCVTVTTIGWALVPSVTWVLSSDQLGPLKNWWLEDDPFLWGNFGLHLRDELLVLGRVGGMKSYSDIYKLYNDDNMPWNKDPVINQSGWTTESQPRVLHGKPLWAGEFFENCWDQELLLSYIYIYTYMGVSKNRGTPKTPQNDHF